MEISQIFHDQGRANMTTKIILRMLFLIIGEELAFSGT